jgi:hypothetical protein
LDGLVFSSEAQVKEVVMRECPTGDAFEVFLDVMSLFCCDPSYSPATGWEKFTRSMEENYSPTVRKVVSSYYQTYGTWYAEGKPVVAGKLLAAFKDMDKWSGSSGMDGRRHEIEVSATMSADIAKIWVGDKLPPEGKLAPLALKMIEVEWIHTVHKHLDYEYTRLTQQFIQDEDALILLSEEVIIMHNRIHAVRCQRMEFVASKDNKADYMARCIWITCQVHRVMQEFVEGGLRNNPAISTAFIRFLTKMTGGNVSAGVGGQIKALTDSIATLKGAATAATAAAKEATQMAKEANTRATTANTNADAAKNSVNSLYSKNSTLKH